MSQDLRLQVGIGSILLGGVVVVVCFSLVGLPGAWLLVVLSVIGGGLIGLGTFLLILRVIRPPLG